MDDYQQIHEFFSDKKTLQADRGLFFSRNFGWRKKLLVGFDGILVWRTAGTPILQSHWLEITRRHPL
jgi:hypothetical protein